MEQPLGPGAIARDQLAANERLAVASLGVGSDYRRFQNLMIRFGLDALPERPAVVSRDDDGAISTSAGLKPAGALRSLELERILKSGDPS